MHIDIAGYKDIAVMQFMLVRKFFSQFVHVWHTDEDAHYQGDIESTALGGAITLRLQYVPRHPEVCPHLYVWDPIVLPMNVALYPGQSVNEKGCCHALHTNPNGPGGRVCICHIHTSQWDPSMTYAQVLLKGALWINAYEGHLQTGNPISDYFRQ